MTAALDATYSVGRNLSGVGVYSRELALHLAEAHPECRFLHCYRPHKWLRGARLGRPANVSLRLLLETRPVRGAELFHGLNQRMPAWRAARTVCTFHDLFVLTADYSTPEFRARFAALAREAAARSDLVVCVSRHTAGMVEELMVRDVSLLSRAVLALTIGYSAFIAEIFRAGIQSVDPGQTDAAKALGLTAPQRFRLVVFPQAIRTILPPLGNDFVAMVKDSSLVSVLGVADVTQMGKLYAAGTFRFFETYSIVAYIYLLLTVSLSLGLRGLEHRLRRKGQA